MRVAPLLRAWLPVPCLFCGGTGGHRGVCAGCRADLPGWEAERCPVCAIGTPRTEVCGSCLRSPPAFSRTLAAASYAFPLDAAIVRLKYGKDLGLTAALGGLMCDAVQDSTLPEALLPMPLAVARLRERGFNQAAELARVLATRLRLPLLVAAARRTRDAAPQASLPLAGRAANVRGAFACSAAAVKGLHVAIVDDVMTTGASLEELARELRRGGARDVSCCVLARTPRPV